MHDEARFDRMLRLALDDLEDEAREVFLAQVRAGLELPPHFPALAGAAFATAAHGPLTRLVWTAHAVGRHGQGAQDGAFDRILALATNDLEQALAAVLADEALAGLVLPEGCGEALCRAVARRALRDLRLLVWTGFSAGRDEAVPVSRGASSGPGQDEEPTARYRVVQG